MICEISNLTKLLTHSPFFQPNLRGPLDSLASVFGLAHRRNLRWHLASSSGEHVCLLLMLLVSLGMQHEILTTLFMVPTYSFFSTLSAL